jgi:simple sugar transport system ATP-binding protein
VSGLAVRGVTKTFGATRALDDVSFHVEPGEIVALIGENGAGKTTLLRVVSGFHRADAGEVLVDGAPVVLRGPRDAAALGIGMVHQHFLLIPELTVAENVVLGRETGSGPLLDLAAAADEVRACAQRFGLDVDPLAKVGELGVAAQQRVELLKVLVRGARTLLLDEPTGLLPPAAVRDLFTLVERLASEGCGVVLVTHRLREVFAVCRRATVLRRGQVTGDRPVATTDARTLARLMVGEDLDTVERGPPRQPGEPLLRVDGVTVVGRGDRPAVDDVSLQLCAGEIVGIAGVTGSGQLELLEAVAGVRPVASGGLSLAGVELGPLDVSARRDAGLSYVPEDRVHDGLVGALTVSENLVLGARSDRGFASCGWLARDRVRAEGDEAVAGHDVRPPDADLLCSALSGGNQQKVLLARELRQRPKVLLAAEPARGLDFRATEAVHGRLRALADDGGGVLFAGTDLPELLEVCDRILVMFSGRIVGEVTPGEDAEERIGLLMAGGEDAS